MTLFTLLTLASLLTACNGPDDPKPEDTAMDCSEPGVICNYAGNGMAGLGAEGAKATETFFYLPQDLTFGPDGNAYVLDWNNHRVRQILTADQTIHTVAGTGEIGDGPEGPANLVKFNHPTNVVFHPDGRMFIAAWHNSRVEAVDLDTGMLTFVCGDGTRSFSGDGGACLIAKLDLPSSIAFDSAANLYISDMANQRIRRMTPDGIIASWGFTGEAGLSGNGGPVSQAQMHATVGQEADPAARMIIHDDLLYLADTDNHQIRIIDIASGIVDAFAGTGTAGTGGDGGAATAAQLRGPRDVAMGPDGEIYIADTDNHCVRVVGTDGAMETFAGQCGVPGYEGDQGLAADALLQRPFGVEVGPDGTVYIADTYNNVLRMVHR